MQKSFRLTMLAGLLALAGNAAAQDGWTGWYVGGNVGHANGDSRATGTLGGQWSVETAGLRTEVVTGLSRDLEPSGTEYGLQFGYNHQFANGFVLGGEFDYSKLNADDEHATGLTPTAAFPALSYDFTHAIETNDQLALRAKFGYAANRHLFYATAGWTQVDVDVAGGMTSNGGYKKSGSASKTLGGSQWGAGYEFDFGNRWSLRAEYLRTNLDDIAFNTDYLAGSTFVSPAYNETIRRDVDLDSFRIGVNYRF